MSSAPLSPSDNRWSWRLDGLALAALALIVALAFASSLANGYVYDDLGVIRDNPRLNNLWDLQGFFTARNLSDADGDNGLYRPLTMWSYALDWALYGSGPFGIHLTNVLLNALLAAAVYGFARQLQASRRLACLMALLYGLHPVHTEVVANGVGRAEIGAELFAVLAGILHFGYLNPPRDLAAQPLTRALKRQERRRNGGESATLELATPTTRSKSWLWGAVGCFLIALLFKESAVTLPGLLFLLDWLVRERGDLRPMLRRVELYLLYALPLVLFFSLRYAAVGGLQVALQDVMARASTSDRVLYALEVLTHYLGQLCFPLHLCAEYSDYRDLVERSLSDQSVLVALGSLGALAGFVWWCARREAWWIVAGLAWFWLAILPVSNLLIAIGTVRADRLLFLPSLGFALALGFALEVVLQRPHKLVRAGGWLLLAGVVGFYGWRTHTRNLDWRSQESLWSVTIAQNPGSAVAWYSWGDELNRLGRKSEAEEAYKRAYTLREDAGFFYPQAHNRLAQLLVDRGERAAAIAEYRLVVTKQPRQYTALCNLGQLLMADPATRAESIQLMTRAIQEKPNDYVPRTNLAQAHWMDGRLNEALAAMDSALRLRPGDPVLVKLKADMQASGAATQSTSGGL